MTTILIVDDTIDLLDLYSIWLRQAGYQVLQASSGKECIRIVRDQMPDLILLDVMLPDLDGLEVCKMIKSETQTAAIPVIHVSGMRTSADNEAEGLEAGADGYLTKPFQQRTLLAHVKALLRLNQTEKALRESHNELEKRVEQRTAELLAANSSLRSEIHERKLSEEALRTAKETLQTIFDAAPVAVLGLDPEGRVTSWSSGAERMFGWSAAETIGRICPTVSKDDLGEFRKIINRVVSHGPETGMVYYQKKRDGEQIQCSINLGPLRDAAGKVVGVTVILEDITERRQAEEALRESEGRYRQMFEKNQAMKLLINPESGAIVDANPAACNFYGFTREEFKNQTVNDLNILSEERIADNIAQALSERKNYFVVRHRLASGEMRDVEVYSSPMDIQGGRLLYSIINDITDRKRAEKERTELLQRIVVAQEDERRRISRELHDQMGQSLAALMLGLKSLENSLEIESPASDALKRLQKVTNQLTQEVHTLASDLRPPALDDFGLHTALLNYVEEWSERSGIVVDFHVNGLIKQRLPSHIETAVYRIVQEALTNVIKHAKAKNTSVIVENRGNRVMAIVEDDGSGFDAEGLMAKPANHQRLGVLGMSERIALVGGSFSIESTPGVGTTVLARIPLVNNQWSKASE